MGSKLKKGSFREQKWDNNSLAQERKKKEAP